MCNGLRVIMQWIHGDELDNRKMCIGDGERLQGKQRVVLSNAGYVHAVEREMSVMSGQACRRFGSLCLRGSVAYDLPLVGQAAVLCSRWVVSSCR